MITRILATLGLGLALAIYLIFWYIIVLLNFLLWDHRAIWKYILSPGAELGWDEVSEAYVILWEKFWRKA